jgi:quercetin dioxygenase-like cupin family protein
MRAFALLLAVALAGCTGAGTARVAGGAPTGAIATYEPPPGINEVLEGAIEAAPGHELVMGDLVIAPGGAIPRHFHAGEEFIYVLGGTTTVARTGHPEVVLGPGEGVRVAPGVIHWGNAGPQGARIISAWVKPVDGPLRIPAPE